MNTPDKVIGTEATAVLWQKIKNQYNGVNLNLLDNWYFLDPVNRKRKNVYTASTAPIYTIDRWLVENGAELRVVKSGIQISQNKYMKQILRGSISEFVGQKVTFSLLHTSGLDSTTFTIEDKIMEASTSFGGKLRIEPLGENFGINIYQGNGDTIFKAAKLEVGDRQTLAYEDNGSWFLSEIPKYSEQYATCRLYDVETGELIQWTFIGD